MTREDTVRSYVNFILSFCYEKDGCYRYDYTGDDEFYYYSRAKKFYEITPRYPRTIIVAVADDFCDMIEKHFEGPKYWTRQIIREEIKKYYKTK